jgi:hypothetical protein
MMTMGILIRTMLMKMLMTVMWNMIMTHHDKESHDWPSQRGKSGGHNRYAWGKGLTFGAHPGTCKNTARSGLIFDDFFLNDF